MRKKTRPTTWGAPTAFTLYLEDVRDLQAIVGEVSDSTKVESENYLDIANVDELASAVKSVDSLALTGIRNGQPQVAIKIEPNSATVWVAEDSAALIGAIEKAKRVMWRHTSVLAPSPTVTMIVLIVGLGASIALASRLVQPLSWAVFLPFAIYLVLISRSRFTTIRLVPKADAPTFWQRQSENIAISVVIGVAGGLLVLALDRLTRP